MRSRPRARLRACALRAAAPVLALSICLGGCANTPLAPSSDLSTDQALVEKTGLRAKMLVHVDKDAVRAAKTVRIMPIVVAAEASKTPLADKDRRLLQNAIGRRICDGLAQDYQVVPPATPADLTVTAEITYVGKTDATAVGASKAMSIAVSALTPVPVIPRLPIGLGGLEVQAQAKDMAGKPVATLVWSRGADIFTNSGRMSDIGDAYALSDDFGNDFNTLVTTGTDPVSAGIVLPKLFNRRSAPACDQYGKRDDVANFVSDQLGLPPDWTDDSSKAAPDEVPLTSPTGNAQTTSLSKPKTGALSGS